ncbi:hypothetical protein O3M35_001897 [Rhynocoris fuscipes]|uniref:BESS domain-containing protein n=1 Tax=Rhynocoris fuscipes TaxID=488301 RepID=A0AAW1CQ11_9HEMI
MSFKKKAKKKGSVHQFVNKIKKENEEVIPIANERDVEAGKDTEKEAKRIEQGKETAKVLKKDETIPDNKYKSDEQFLLSILPTLKRLTHQKSAEARIKIQKILYEIEFGPSEVSSSEAETSSSEDEPQIKNAKLKKEKRDIFQEKDKEREQESPPRGNKNLDKANDQESSPSIDVTQNEESKELLNDVQRDIPIEVLKEHQKHEDKDKLDVQERCKSDEQFLNSILPSLKRLNGQQNAEARVKIQHILFEVEYERPLYPAKTFSTSRTPSYYITTSDSQTTDSEFI